MIANVYQAVIPTS